MLGTVLKQEGRLDQALAEFRQALKYEPDSAEAHLSIGQVLRQQNDLAGADQAFAAADRLNKRKADAQAAAFASSGRRQPLKRPEEAPTAVEPPERGRAPRSGRQSRVLVSRARPRCRPDGVHHLRREDHEPVSARDDRIGRRADRLRRRRPARHVPGQRHDARGLSERPGAAAAPVPEPRQRHLRGRHRPGRLARPVGLGPGRLRRRLRQRRPRRSVRDLLREQSPVPQHRARHVRGGDGGQRPDSDQAAMGHRLRVSRHRPRRPAGPVCRQLHRSRSGDRADARLGLVPVQRRPGRVRTAWTDRRQEPAVSEHGRRHVRRRVGQFGDHQGQRVVRARRRDAGLRQRRLDRHLRGQRLEPERAVPQSP